VQRRPFVRELLHLAAALVVGASVALSSFPLAGAADRVGTNKIPPMPSRQLGIDVLFSYSKESTSALLAQANKNFSYIKSLGANSVSITFDIYVKGATLNSVYVGPGTPTAAALKKVIADAESYHLAVEVRPVIDEFNPKDLWRGGITPSNIPKWIASYDSILEPFLVASQAASANEFVIATELNQLNTNKIWGKTVIPFVREHYQGGLVFNVAWNEPGIVALSGTSLSIDTYPSVVASNNATVARLEAGWNAHLKELPLPVPDADAVMQEVGIAAQDGAYAAPEKLNWNTKYVPKIQANWFDAACDFFNSHHVKGIYFYSITFNRGPQKRALGGQPTDFQGLGTSAIKSCFAS
jgi:hypothetical protein